MKKQKHKKKSSRGSFGSFGDLKHIAPHGVGHAGKECKKLLKCIGLCCLIFFILIIFAIVAK